MAKKKMLGNGSIVRINSVAVGFLQKVTPPEYARDAVDVTSMDSVIEDMLDADPPKIGSLKMTVAWDPADTGDDAIETIFFNTDPSAREVPIEVELPSTPRKKLAFSGRILKITPAQVAQKELIARELEIQPTTKPVKTTVA